MPKDINHNDDLKKNHYLGKNYLLLIAIDRYQYVSKLYNAVNDVEAIESILVSRYQFQYQNVIKLIDAEATKAKILIEFDRLLERLNSNDNLIVYFAGHGEFHELTKRGYWIPVDGVVGDRSTYLSNNEVIDFFKNLKAKHIFALIDSCFSGALFARERLLSKQERLDAIPSRWLLTSGRNEPVSDGFINDHSPFAKSLLTQLEANSDSAIGSAEICENVLDGVIFNAEQTPRGEPLHGVGHQGGQFFFYPKSYDPNKTVKKKNKTKKRESEDKRAPKVKKRKQFLQTTLAVLSLIFAVLAITPVGSTISKIFTTDKTIDLMLRVYKDGSTNYPMTDGQIKIDMYELKDKEFEIDSLGKCILQNIPEKYRDNKFAIEFYTHDDNIATEEIHIPKIGNSASMHLPKTFSYKSIHGRIVREKGSRPLSNAIVQIDETFSDTTDKQGLFELAIPFTEGEKKLWTVLYASDTLYKYKNILTFKINPTITVTIPE